MPAQMVACQDVSMLRAWCRQCGGEILGAGCVAWMVLRCYPFPSAVYTACSQHARCGSGNQGRQHTVQHVHSPGLSAMSAGLSGVRHQRALQDIAGNRVSKKLLQILVRPAYARAAANRHLPVCAAHRRHARCLQGAGLVPKPREGPTFPAP